MQHQRFAPVAVARPMPSARRQIALTIAVTVAALTLFSGCRGQETTETAAVTNAETNSNTTTTPNRSAEVEHDSPAVDTPDADPRAAGVGVREIAVADDEPIVTSESTTATTPTAVEPEPEAEAEPPVISENATDTESDRDTDPVAARGPIEWPHLQINMQEKYVDIEGVVGIDIGWLEQIVCLPGTRTHESLMISFAKPSHVHAALLLIGLEAGKPGRWRLEDEGLDYTVDPPEGSAVLATFLYDDPDTGEPREVPIHAWVRDHNSGARLPNEPWIFGGSRMVEDFQGREVYEADVSGSIMGLVTFGDELLGWSQVLPDQEDVMMPEWEADPDAVPAPDTPVTLRLRAWPTPPDVGTDADSILK